MPDAARAVERQGPRHGARGPRSRTPAIRNLIREDKIHQIYSTMQSGQSKFGMQTFNQSLATLYLKKLITLEAALSRSSMPDELQELINRGVGVNVPTHDRHGRARGV